MNTFSLIIASVLLLLTLGFAVMLGSAIVFNLRIGKKYRKSLAVGVGRLRLGKMLTALGIDVNTYLHTEPVVDIRNHMDRCAACKKTDECDDKLSQGDIDPEAIDFCNNEQSLQHMVNRKTGA